MRRPEPFRQPIWPDQNVAAPLGLLHHGSSQHPAKGTLEPANPRPPLVLGRQEDKRFLLDLHGHSVGDGVGHDGFGQRQLAGDLQALRRGIAGELDYAGRLPGATCSLLNQLAGVSNPSAGTSRIRH